MLHVCDIMNRKGGVEKTRTLRLIGNPQLTPGQNVCAQRDAYGSPKRRFRFIARCLRTGTLLLQVI
jgi:hypothetical protein